ncbi:MAG: ATP-dependent DNA ligase [bacterium]
MEFRRLVEYFTQIEKTTLRNEMMEILAKLLGEVGKDEIAEVVNLSLGQLRPKFDRLEFGLAEKMVIRAIAEARGQRLEEITKRFKVGGDLGEIMIEKGERVGIRGEEKELTVGEVFKELEGIAKESGQGSQERKITRLARLLKKLEPESGKYVVRVVMGKLRLGFSDKTILDALSYFEFGSKEGREEVERAYQVFPDVGKISKWVKVGGIKSLKDKAQVQLGTPVMSALAQRLRTAEEMIEKMGEVVVEPKYDGQRVEIHWSRNKQREQDESEGGQDALFKDEKPKEWVKTFTRNLDENTKMFPELERMGGQITGEEVILDSEAVGYEPETGKMVPFQTTITRKRKHGVSAAQKTVPLRFYVFDILYKDGKSLLSKPLLERRKILENTIKKGEVLEVDDAIITKKASELRAYHTKQLSQGLEGALVKKSQGKYEPGRQGWNWVKFKEEEGEVGKLSDTVDGVVMGYYVGKGKRQKFGLGAFLVGVREGEKILTIAKIGTGITDKQFDEIYQKLENLKTKDKDKNYVVGKSLVPDFWVKPELVVEVAADEVTNSPTHTSGYALRFPRLVRLRTDKTYEEATTVVEVEEIAGV